MAIAKLLDRVKMSVTGTPGTGSITLGSAAVKYQSLTGAGAANGDTVSYLIDDNATWEIGVGTYNSGVLSRDTVKASSSGGSKISASSAATVFITVLAQDIQSGIGANNLVRLDGNSRLGVKTLAPAVSLDINDTDAMRVPAGTTAQRPGTGAAGYLRYNSSTGRFEGYGSAWGSLGGGASISDAAPSGPQPGDIWWNSADGILYVYYSDGTSSQWVATDAGGEGQYLPLTGGAMSGSITFATWTTGTRPASPAAGQTGFNTTTGLLETYNGSAWTGIAGGLTGVLNSMAAQASTSGTSIDFTSIPAWAKRVTVMLNGVSLSGAAAFLFQLGSGSVQTTGYAGGGARYGGSALGGASVTNGFSPNNTTAAATYGGHLILTNVSGNIWAASGNFGASGGTESGCMCGGSVTLSGVLDRVRITTSNGTDTFDAGSINVMYE